MQEMYIYVIPLSQWFHVIPYTAYVTLSLHYLSN